MPKFAEFNPDDDPPQQVFGWYDTDAFDYPYLPDDSNLLMVSEDQWTDHLDDPGGWAVQDDLLVPFIPAPPPPPSTQEQARILLNGPVTVQSMALPNLNADYPIDSITTNQITSIASSINAGLGLPGGGPVFNWPDVGAVQHQWPAVQFTDFATQVMNFLYAAGQTAQGYSNVLPSPVLVIV